MFGIEFSIVGIISLILAIWAIIQTINSDASTGAKVLWVVIVLIMPLLGFVLWFFFGPKANR